MEIIFLSGGLLIYENDPLPATINKGDIFTGELLYYSASESVFVTDEGRVYVRNNLFAILHPSPEPPATMPKILIAFPFETLLTVRNSLASDEEEEISLAADEPLEVEAINDGDEGCKNLYLGGFKLIYNAPGNFQIIEKE